MTKDFLYDVFLSHNHKDKPRVRKLAQQLQQAGLRVWFDEWNVQGGDIIALKVDEGLEQSRVLVLCISSNSLSSGWVALERSTAVHRDPSNNERRFIPILLDECELPDTLRRYKTVDFRQDEAAAFAELLAAFKVKPPETITTEEVEQTDSDVENHPPEPSNFRIPPGVKRVATLKGHTSHTHVLSWSPDGKFLASSDTDYKLKLWSTSDWKFIQTLEGGALDFSWSPNSTSLLITDIESECSSVESWPSRPQDSLY